jgi:predicted nuclease with TOPRIM domain
MTNEEAIEELESAYSDNVFRDGEYEACRIAINSIQENTKLKADVEQFSNELISVLIENELLKKKNELTNYYFEQYSAAIDEVEKLKEDYEQLKISDASKEQSSIDYYNLYRQALNEVKQLKSELEQSVKLPCKKIVK